MLHVGIRETYQKLVGENLVPIPACRYKTGDAGVSGDALCRGWERTSYLLCACLKMDAGVETTVDDVALSEGTGPRKGALS